MVFSKNLSVIALLAFAIAVCHAVELPLSQESARAFVSEFITASQASFDIGATHPSMADMFAEDLIADFGTKEQQFTNRADFLKFLDVSYYTMNVMLFDTQNLVASENSILMAYGFAGFVNDCSFVMDAILFLRLNEEGLIAEFAIGVDQNAFHEQCPDIPIMRPLFYADPVPNDCSARTKVKNFNRAVTSAINAQSLEERETAFTAFTDGFLTPETSMHVAGTPAAMNIAAFKDYFYQAWCDGTKFWRMDKVTAVKSTQTGIFHISYASGILNNNCRSFVPYGGYYKIDANGKITELHQLWGSADVVRCPPGQEREEL